MAATKEIQNDTDGNLWIVEDIGGANKPGSVNAKFPNSFIYRYVPAHKGDLKHGKLQALQVLNAAGTPITVESQAAINAPGSGRIAQLRDQLRNALGNSARHGRRRHDAVQRERGGEGSEGNAVQAAGERRLPAWLAFR